MRETPPPLDKFAIALDAAGEWFTDCKNLHLESLPVNFIAACHAGAKALRELAAAPRAAGPQRDYDFTNAAKRVSEASMKPQPVLAGLDVPDIAMARAWAMPSPHTFSIPPIAELLDRWLTDRTMIIDPFCGQSTRATLRNDLKNGSEATEWLRTLRPNHIGLNIWADAVLFDPPYSPRQISEVYRSVGLHVGTAETQNARLYKSAKDGLDALLGPGGIAICCGWNSAGFGKKRGYQMLEILLVAHGGAHNDTIVTVERKR